MDPICKEPYTRDVQTGRYWVFRVGVINFKNPKIT
jgi:hypothetical protein